jgi:hypothetical protein
LASSVIISVPLKDDQPAFRVLFNLLGTAVGTASAPPLIGSAVAIRRDASKPRAIFLGRVLGSKAKVQMLAKTASAKRGHIGLPIREAADNPTPSARNICPQRTMAM